jgi:hypothetical protein
MNSTLTATVIAASLCGAVLLGTWIRRRLPQSHLSSDTKDAVKLAMGLVATMAALLLGLLVSFSLFAPSNATASIASMVAALSVAGALFLILELDQPFSGLIRISSDPLLNALAQSDGGKP